MSRPVKVAIMQPYFLPYIGYWQLMSYVDIFIVYDNIKYTKKGWINRNRFLLNGKPEIFSIPLRKDSDCLDVRDRRLSLTFDSEKNKLMRRLDSAYCKAPYYREGKSFLIDVMESNEENLFLFILNSINQVHSRLELKSRIIPSSTLDVHDHLKGEERVIAICKETGATHYINPIGGVGLYNPRRFSVAGINLLFQQVNSSDYVQYKHDFVPHLSIIDCIMFLGFKGVKELLPDMILLEGMS